MNGRERPTTPSRSDLSSGGPRTSAAPASIRRSPEHALFHGYRGLTSGARVAPSRRTEECVCGGYITAETGWEAAAIDEHAATLEHQQWRRARGIETPE